MKSANAMKIQRGKIFRVSWWKYLLVWPLYQLYKLYHKTLRFHVNPEDEAILEKAKSDANHGILMTWHNRQFIISELISRYAESRPMNLLVSPAQDAAWLVAYFSMLGIKSIRGSSTRGSIAAARELVNCYSNEECIGITPDGPSGPLYKIKLGAFRIIKLVDANVLLVVPNPRNAWRLKTWDRCYIPKPFSTVDLKYKFIPNISKFKFRSDEEAMNYIENTMKKMTLDDWGEKSLLPNKCKV